MKNQHTYKFMQSVYPWDAARELQKGKAKVVLRLDPVSVEADMDSRAHFQLEEAQEMKSSCKTLAETPGRCGEEERVKSELIPRGEKEAGWEPPLERRAKQDGDGNLEGRLKPELPTGRAKQEQK